MSVDFDVTWYDKGLNVHFFVQKRSVFAHAASDRGIESSGNAIIDNKY